MKKWQTIGAVLYDATIYNDDAGETGEEVIYDAHNDIVAEDKYFAENQDKLNQNSDAVYLELLEKYKSTQFLGQRLRVINRQLKFSQIEMTIINCKKQ